MDRTEQEQMGMPVGEFHLLHEGRVDLRKLHLSLGSDPNHFDSPTEDELLNAGCNSISEDHCISVEGCPRNASVKLTTAVFHTTHDVDHRISIAVLEFCYHLCNR